MAETSPLVAEPLYGLRTWTVAGPHGHERLIAPHRRTPWPPGGAWLDATCERDADHVAPEHDCVCGIHALHPNPVNARRVLGLRREIPGIVECVGPVEVHPDGFRAGRGRPYALVLLRGRNAALFRRLSQAYGAEVVEVRGPADLDRWCRERRLGLAPSVVEDLLGPGTAQEWRRLKRRDARVAAARVCAAVLGALAIAALAHTALSERDGQHSASDRTGPHLADDGPAAP
jgi:hypothetical protein